MEKKAVITSTQLLLLLIWSRLMLHYSFMPVLSAPPKNQDVWIVAILSIAYIALLSLPLLFLRNRYRSVPAVEITQSVLGNVCGGAAVLVFVLLTLFCFASCVLTDVVFISATLFPETPKIALLLFILVPVGFTAYHGIGTIGRISIVIVPYIILTILMFFLMGLKDMDLDVLKPVLADSSILDLNRGAFLNAAIHSEIILFFVFGEFLEPRAKKNRIYLLDLCFYLVLLLMMLVPVMGVLGTDLARHVWNPYFMYAKQLKAYEFLYRMESLSVLAWFLGSLLRSSIFCYMASYLLSGLFRDRKTNRAVIPLCVLIFSVMMVPAVGTSETLRKLLSYDVLPYIILPAAVLLPLVMTAVYGVKRLLKRGREAGEDTG